MSPFLAFLVAAQGPVSEPPSPLRPLVVVTRDPQPEDTQLTLGRPSLVPDPKAPGKWIEVDAARTRERLLAARGLVVRDLGGFLLAAPPDLLGVPQARREASLMRDIARRAAGGARVLAIKDLSPEAAQTLRDKLSTYQEPHNLRVKNSPYLRFGIATEGLLEVRSGRLQRTLSLLPVCGDGTERDALRGAIMQPDAEDAAAGIAPSGPPLTVGPPPDVERPSGKPALKEKPVPYVPKGRLTFLVPPRLPGERGLEWMGTAQAALLKEAREARTDWTLAQDALLAALKQVADAPFAHPPASGTQPGFADLTPKAQENAAQYFGAEHRNDLGGLSGADWLRNAQTLDYRVRPVLTMSVAADGGRYVNLIGFECPIGP